MKSKEFIITKINLEDKETIKVPVTQKPRQGPLRPQTGGGAHRDKKKEQKQGKEKHKGKMTESIILSEREMDNLVGDLHKNAYGIDPDISFWAEWLSFNTKQKKDLYNSMVSSLETQNVSEAVKKPNATTRHLRDYPVSDKDVAKPVKKPEKKKPEQGVAEGSENLSIGQQMARDGITYSPEKEKELIALIGDYMKRNGMTEKQIRYYLSYDEDFIPDQLSDLPREGQGVKEGFASSEQESKIRARLKELEDKDSDNMYAIVADEFNMDEDELRDALNDEKSTDSLSLDKLATISDEALDKAYGYGRSSPGNTFGWQANLKSAEFAKKIIDSGETDIEKIGDAIHKGWNVTAKQFVNDPDQFSDTEKLRAAGKLEAKLAQREKLMNINYDQLPDDEKEKDRVVARALLKAITGKEEMAERFRDPEDWDEGNTEPPNNFAVYINGKKWKVFQGRGRYAEDEAELRHYQQLRSWAAKKSAETGKKWEVYITGEPATESIKEDTNIPFDQCPHCRGDIVHESLMMEKQDACYHKVKSRYKVWPSAYASGALVQCRKKGAKNWGKKK